MAVGNGLASRDNPQRPFVEFDFFVCMRTEARSERDDARMSATWFRQCDGFSLAAAAGEGEGTKEACPLSWCKPQDHLSGFICRA